MYVQMTNAWLTLEENLEAGSMWTLNTKYDWYDRLKLKVIEYHQGLMIIKIMLLLFSQKAG